MAEHAAEHTHGHMDIREQQASFEGFMRLTKWGSLAVATLVLFAVLTFCTNTGWFGAAIVAIIVAAAGIFVLREKPAPAH